MKQRRYGIMTKKISALLLALLMCAGVCSCGKNSEEATETTKAPRKETRKIVDYSDTLTELENIDKDCTGFVKSGDITKTELFNDKGAEITAESIEYRDDHAELTLTVKNSNDYTLLIEKSICVLNYFQNADAGIFAAAPNSTETWVYNIDYFPAVRFGVSQIDSVQFGIKLYRYPGDKSEIAEDITSAVLLEGAEQIPVFTSSDLTDQIMSVFKTEVLKTSNYTDTGDVIRGLLDSLYEEDEDIDETYADTMTSLYEDFTDLYIPEDPLLAAYESDYADFYFLQKTDGITAVVYNEDNDCRVTSAAFGEIKNEEYPGNKWFQYAFYNGTDETVNVTTKNIRINGLSVASRSSSFAGINCLPGTSNLIHDLMFPIFFNRAHWDIFGIDDIYSLSFDYEITPAGASEGQTYHADAYFADTDSYPDTSGETVYDKNDIVIKSKGIFENSAFYAGDYTAAYIVENNSSEDIYISLPVANFYSDDLSFVEINGESASAYSKCKDEPLLIPAGGAGEYCIDIDAVSLKDRNIYSADGISEMSHTVNIRDYRERLIEQADIDASFK